IMTEGVSTDTATFTVSRSGSTASAVDVTLQPSGTATKWNDYRRTQGDMPDTFTIPAGQSSVTVTLYAPGDTETEAAETAILTVAGSANYSLGTPSSVTLTILPPGGASGDGTPPTVSVTSPANNATVSGAAVTVAANASDNLAVAAVQFKLDGYNLGTEVASP